MKHAFDKAGGPTMAEAEFTVTLTRAVAKFQKAGGTLKRASELLLDTASKLEISADQEKNDTLSLIVGADDKGARDQSLVDTQAAPVPRVRVTAHTRGGPSAADKQAAARAAKSSAQAVMKAMGWAETARIPGGPPVRELRWRDLEPMRDRMLREGGERLQHAALLELILREGSKLGTPDPERRCFDDLTPDTIRQISAKTTPEVLKPMARGWIAGFAPAALQTIDG
jgi:hypothetical protein